MPRARSSFQGQGPSTPCAGTGSLTRTTSQQQGGGRLWKGPSAIVGPAPWAWRGCETGPGSRT
eukprot:767095-Hanusia_phi.AAC.2